ncbi:hypothetical protein QBC46DRAFT_341967 [Diplogelasinospora grovesii]|uniref:Uncharacterized protein n=1 Tax=Diplogelasinospora grovesii TaxID=303347 RepID=A0AAN6N866_9PEZI|nr:hypothetical protein QBC46DRAFT_341967 [Diplogelasinospora grovesii]
MSSTSMLSVFQAEDTGISPGGAAVVALVGLALVAVMLATAALKRTQPIEPAENVELDNMQAPPPGPGLASCRFLRSPDTRPGGGGWRFGACMKWGQWQRIPGVNAHEASASPLLRCVIPADHSTRWSDGLTTKPPVAFYAFSHWLPPASLCHLIASKKVLSQAKLLDEYVSGLAHEPTATATLYS